MVLSYLSALRLSVRKNSTSTGRIFMNVILDMCTEICPHIAVLIKIGQTQRTLHAEIRSFMNNMLAISAWLPWLLRFHSIYGATVPSGPWSPSEDASMLLCHLLLSSILVILGSMICFSRRRSPILFLVIPLVLISH